MLPYLVIAGAIVQLGGVAAYIKETIAGRAKPNRVSWLFWSIAPLIASAAALSSGVRWAVLPVFMSGFGPFLVLLASFANKKSYWKLEKFDYLCGLFSLLALILWGLTRDPLIAIIFAVLSDVFAAVPSLIKSWRYPETETVNVYATGLFNALTSFAAISAWTAASLIFPIYLVVIDLSFVLAVGRKRFRPK